MNPQSLLLLAGGLRCYQPKSYHFRPDALPRRPSLLNVKPVDPQPVRPALPSGNREVPACAHGGRSGRAARICLCAVAFLFVLTAMAGGLGMQRIQHRRELFRLGQQLRQSETTSRQIALACQTMRASYVAHLAQDRQQSEVRTVAYARVKARSTTKS
jgi:hypothetical protein